MTYTAAYSPEDKRAATVFYVYELRDESDTCFYVGKGRGQRMHEHVYKARAGQDTPRAARIRQILARRGTVEAVPVFWTSDEQAAYAEEVRLIAFHGRHGLTNQTSGGCGIRDLSPESREKIAASRRGVVASAETRQRQRTAKLGKPRSPETRAKIAAYQRGSAHPWARLPRSQETRRKLATFAGRKHSRATIAKMRAAKMGHVVSAETRRKLSIAKKGSIPWNKGRRTKP